MIEWIVDTQGWSVEDAIEWIDVNVIPALGFMGPAHPTIMYRLQELGGE